MISDSLFIDIEPRRGNAKTAFVPIELSIKGISGFEYYTPLVPQLIYQHHNGATFLMRSHSEKLLPWMK